MTSVSRMLEYTNLPSEETKYTVDVDKDWPQQGSILFKRVNLRYEPHSPFVLKV